MCLQCSPALDSLHKGRGLPEVTAAEEGTGSQVSTQQDVAQSTTQHVLVRSCIVKL